LSQPTGASLVLVLVTWGSACQRWPWA
jgi:hypothetical protein